MLNSRPNRKRQSGGILFVGYRKKIGTGNQSRKWGNYLGY